MKSLYEQFDAAVKEAEKLLAEGNIGDEYKAAKEKVEQLSAAIKEMKELQEAKSSVKSAGFAVPGTSGTAFVGSADDETEETTQNEKENPGDVAQRFFFKENFGGLDHEVDLVLKDLYGPDYIAKFINHRRAFSKYVRGGEKALSREDEHMLRQVVLTPAVVKEALLSGQDYRSLKDTLVEAVDTLGGYTVPVDIQQTVIRRIAGNTVVRGRARGMSTRRDRVEFPKATGGDDQYTTAARVTWVEETPTAGTAETTFTWGLEEVPVYTAMADIPVSRNMLEDSAFNIESWIAEAFAEAAAIDEDNKFLIGDGIKKPLGILPGGVNDNGLAEIVSGSASALTWDAIIDLVHEIPSQYRQNAVWIMNRHTVAEIRKLKDTAGNYLWDAVEFRGGAAGQQRTLEGHPVIEQEAMPDVAANAYPIIFADLRGYYLVDRIGMSVERYIDSSSARQNLVYFVMRRRLGGRPVENYRFAVMKVST